MTDFEALFSRQGVLVNEIQRTGSNFDKDSASRKTSEYLQKRLESLDNLWGEFLSNNDALQLVETKSQRYFIENIFDKTKAYYTEYHNKISAFTPTTSSNSAGSTFSASEIKKNELISQQKTNFRAFKRQILSFEVSEISEKWELEDELRTIQSRWNTIDKLHLEIDNILQGEDDDYQYEFLKMEIEFKKIKRALNQKLAANSHLQQSTPLLEIPTFTGSYTHWPTFFDLFTKSIHNNNFLSNGQKMQHLKGKVRGEAERLIQHLNISDINYDIAWEILTHRYNNPQVLFTTHIETLLNQPSISKQSSKELKRIYDTTAECIHAIDNLGVDTSTWDPLLVHILIKKLDSDTLSAYKEARKSPRDLASLDEFMTFLEGKFIALEPIFKQERETLNKPASAPQHPKPFYKPAFNYSFNQKGYQAAATSTLKCPLCKSNHELYRCPTFVDMPAETKLRSVAKLQLCKNCLFKHTSYKCNSIKRCKECNGEHHTQLHDACAGSSNADTTTPVEPKPQAQPEQSATTTPSSDKQNSANHAGSDNDEVLLATVLLNIKAIDGNYVTLRALLDQGSQITLMSENAAQLLGLPRRTFSTTVTGVGISSKQSKNLVSLECKSIYNNYSFNTEASIIPRVINNLPNTSFSKQTWPHLRHMNLADPEYNVSKPIDILLGACVYSGVIMSGLVKGDYKAPIAQQTKLGWILSGNIKTFNCSVVSNYLADSSKFLEMEEIPSSASNLTTQEQYGKEHCVIKTKLLLDNKVVTLPLTESCEESLTTSNTKATAQFKKLESKIEKNEAFSDSYKQFMRDYQHFDHMKQNNLSKAVLGPDSSSSPLRMVFNASSPQNTLAYDLNAQLAQDDTSKYPLTTSALQNNFYVDNLLSKRLKTEEIQQRQLIESLQADIQEESIQLHSNLQKLQNFSLSSKGSKLLTNFDPESIKIKPNKTSTLETKKMSVNAALQQPHSSFIDKLFAKNNFATQVAKIAAWVSRFTAALQHSSVKTYQYLSTNKINKPYEQTLNYTQGTQLQYETNFNLQSHYQLANLRPFLHKNGIVGGHPSHSNLSVARQHTHQQTLPPESKKLPRGNKRDIFKKCFTLTLLLFSLIIPPSIQQEVSYSNVTTLNDNRALYFDKISNLQYIRDEWRLVVYYNLTGYWQSIAYMDNYVQQLRKMTSNSSTQYKSVTDQLTHELTEIEHYNHLLETPSRKRQRRGLVNGVGSLANYLFGVLDDNFAQKYAKDIEKISYNENHLKQLIKNQTIIIEAELNIIQRNERIMNKQFSQLNAHLQALDNEINSVRTEANTGLYITSSALAASMILESLRRMQNSLIDTVTDITHGRIDTHLFSSEQLEEQINFISAQLQGDLKLPSETGNVRELYKLLKVFAKIYKSYLIIEIKVPLISNEIYELDRIISIPHNNGKTSYVTVPTYPYLAFNLKKDMVIFLSDFDLQSCLHASEDKIMCTLDKPLYDFNLKQNICNLTLINAGQNITPCINKQLPCVDRWIKLHRPNLWLYSCCEKCDVRIFCTADMTMSTLTGNGLLELSQGCTLKGDTFMIHSHNNFLNKIAIQPLKDAPELSILNTIINTSIPRYEFTTENHERIFHDLMEKINITKQEQESDLSIHDIHQYSISYVILVIIIAVAVFALVLRFRRRRLRSAQLARLAVPPGGGLPVSRALATRPSEASECRVSSECSELRKSVSMGILSVGRGAAPPKPKRSVSIPIPS